MKPFKVAILCAVLFLFGLGIGVLLKARLPASGGGQYQRSPDDRFVAHASTLDEGTLIGPHRTYYEFMIQTAGASPHTVRRMTVDDTVQPSIDWREEGRITWQTNGASVSFDYDGPRTQMHISLKNEP